ncbi:MAG: shikimate kinase [Schleiferiaceae bacterium]
MIILLGYMGSGKTSVGKALSKLTQWSFTDLDQYIEKKYNQSISDLFEEGEISFRTKEREALLELKEELPDEHILSVGGGTPCYYDNMDVINSMGQTVYLRTSIGNLVSRLSAEVEHRPMIARVSEDDLPEFLGKHLFERRAFYEKASVTIDTKDSPQELAAQIWNRFQNSK